MSIIEKINIVWGYIQKVDFSLVISVLAAVISFSSSKVAVKTLKMQQYQNEKSKPNLNIDIQDSKSVYNKESNKIDYIFEVLIKNDRSISNSVYKVQLEMKSSYNKNPYKMVLDYRYDSSDNTKFNTSTLPFSIDANKSDVLVCLFPYPYDDVYKFKINEFTVNVIDTHDKVYSDTVYKVDGGDF